jgi:hypothetical protein
LAYEERKDSSDDCMIQGTGLRKVIVGFEIYSLSEIYSDIHFDADH